MELVQLKMIKVGELKFLGATQLTSVQMGAHVKLNVPRREIGG